VRAGPLLDCGVIMLACLSHPSSRGGHVALYKPPICDILQVYKPVQYPIG
jgi:hypothetical protein